MVEINQSFVVRTDTDDCWYEYAEIYYDKSSCNLFVVPDESADRFLQTDDMVLVFSTLKEINKLDIKLR